MIGQKSYSQKKRNAICNNTFLPTNNNKKIIIIAFHSQLNPLKREREKITFPTQAVKKNPKYYLYFHKTSFNDVINLSS